MKRIGWKIIFLILLISEGSNYARKMKMDRCYGYSRYTEGRRLLRFGHKVPTVGRLGQAIRTRVRGIERKSHGTIGLACGCLVKASILDAIGVDAWSGPLSSTGQWIAIPTFIKDVFQIEGMDVSGEVAGDTAG
jgi:hypothetical protein